MAAGSHPWEVDRPLTLEAARAAIGAGFPGIDVRGLVHLGSGWEFDAFLTGDGRVFRFPRRPVQRRHGQAVIALHVLPLAAVGDGADPPTDVPGEFVQHRAVPGGVGVEEARSRLRRMETDISA